MRKLAFAALLGTTALIPAAGTAQTAAPQQSIPAAEANAIRPVAVSAIRGKDVYNLRGEDLGEIERIVLGQGDRTFAVIKFGEVLGLGGQSRILPLDRLALQDDRVVIRGMSEAEFKALPVWRDNLAGYRAIADSDQVRVPVAAAADAGAERMADGTDIVVRQPAPTVRVDQAAPRVVVRPAQPQVTVQQARPEIIVRQAPPTITVQQPQPEIIVRMPEPDVNVAMAPPQVQVRQPQPQVQVVQPQQQPQVQVQPAQPQVTVRPPQQQAQVQLQRVQPVVRVERTGEPRVVYRQAEGQPRVMYERVAESDMTREAQAGAANANPVRPVAVSEIEGKDVYNLRGEDLGEVERVVLGQGDRTFAVIKFGEVLGLGGQSRILPLDRMRLQDDRIVVPDMSEAELKALPAWRDDLAGYRDMADGDRVNLAAYLAAADRAHDRAGLPVNERLALARERLGVLDPDTTAATARPAGVRPVPIGNLDDMDVFNIRGERLGEIDRVIMNTRDNKRYAILEHGGFLGLGEDQVAIPINRFFLRGDDDLVIRGLTEAELEALPDWERRMGDYRVLADDERLELGIYE